MNGGENMKKIMNWVAMSITEKVQGSTFGYTQSDEISILLYPWMFSYHYRSDNSFFL